MKADWFIIGVIVLIVVAERTFVIKDILEPLFKELKTALTRKGSYDTCPKTTEELEWWLGNGEITLHDFYAMQDCGTRVSVGIDSIEPNVYGIYKYKGKFVVYNNDDNGVRYNMLYTDNEEQAVKLLADTLIEVFPSGSLSYWMYSDEDVKKTKTGIIITIVAIIIAIILSFTT